MNRKERTRQILRFLSRSPLSTIREISDNASQTRINHNVSRKILVELLQDNKIDQLFGHYYVMPTIKNEIPLLLKITKLDKVLKPRFKKLSYEDKSKYGKFQYILELYILLIRLQFRIYKSESNRAKKSYSSDKKNIKEIRMDLVKYLKSFKVKKNASVEDIHNYLIKQIDDSYFRDSRYFYDLVMRSRTLKERVQMLSTYFKTNNLREITDQFEYESNKMPRKMVDEWFHDNRNIHFEEIYAGILTGEIKDEDVSGLFFQWWAYMGLTHTKTKDGREFTEEELKEYRRNFMKNFKRLFKTDVKKVVDVNAYGIS